MSLYYCIHDHFEGNVWQQILHKSWSIISQGMFQLQEINQIEHKFCQYLKWELNINPDTLKELEDMVQRAFAGPGPYPTHVLPAIFKLIASLSCNGQQQSHLSYPLLQPLTTEAHPTVTYPAPNPTICIHLPSLDTQHTITLSIGLDKPDIISKALEVACRDGNSQGEDVCFCNAFCLVELY